MTNLELAVVGFFALFLAGTASFVTASHNARWTERQNAIPQYVEPTEWAQVGFRGGFAP